MRNMWQDLVLSSIGIVFTLSLIPQLKDVLKKQCKMNWVTCSITSIGCFIIAYVDYTLDLQISAIVAVATGIVWGLMLVYPMVSE
jgi:hypothetical protein